MNKQVKIGVSISLFLIFLVGAIAGLNYYLTHKDIVKEKDPGLTQEERKIYEDRLSEARTKLNDPGVTDDQKFNLYMQEGFQLYGLGKYVEATDAFTKASEIHKQDANPYIALYQVQFDMNDNKGAKASIKKSLELKNDSADIWKKYIGLEIDRFEISNEKADGLFQQAIEATKNNSSQIDIITTYAQFLETVGNIQGAIDNWQKAIQLNNSNSAVYEQEIQRLKSKQ